MYLSANTPPLSPSDISGGYTTPGLSGLGAVTDAQIAAWVQSRLMAKDAPEVKARDLVAFMKTQGLTPERVAKATGYPLQNVNEAIALAGPTGGGLGPLLLAVGAYYLLGA